VLSLESSAKIVANGVLNTYDTLLGECMRKHGSDKCSDWHNYTTIYMHLLNGKKVSTIFELGIFKGASVRGWSSCYPSASIFAADVDPNYLVNEGNIRSYLCDQDSLESIENLWREFDRDCPFLKPDEGFDLMIDDGKHEFSSNLTFLMGSSKMLAKDGIYVVEDLTHQTSAEFSKILQPLKDQLEFKEMFILEIPNSHNLIDNALLIATK
jgi:hypothetical protein